MKSSNKNILDNQFKSSLLNLGKITICGGIIVAGTLLNINMVRNATIHTNVKENITALKSKNPSVKLSSITDTGTVAAKMPMIKVTYNAQLNKLEISGDDKKYSQEIEQLKQLIDLQWRYAQSHGYSDDIQNIIKYNPALAEYGYSLLELQRLNITFNKPIKSINTVGFFEKNANHSGLFDVKYKDIRHIIRFEDGTTFQSKNLVDDYYNGYMIKVISYK